MQESASHIEVVTRVPMQQPGREAIADDSDAGRQNHTMLPITDVGWCGRWMASYTIKTDAPGSMATLMTAPRISVRR